MDITKLQDITADYMSEYLSIFVATLRNPTLRFHPRVINNSQTDLILGSQPKLDTQLNPKLLGFVALNIFIGSSVTSLIPGVLAEDTFVKNLIIIFAYWVFGSCIAYLACRLLKGRGSFLETWSVSLQITSVLHVVTAFITLAVAGIILTLQPGNFIAIAPSPSITSSSGLAITATTTITSTTMTPVTPTVPVTGTAIALACGPSTVTTKGNALVATNLFFFVHLILASIYLPIGLKNVHGFGTQQTIILFILLLLISRIPQYPLSIAIHQITNVMSSGGC